MGRRGQLGGEGRREGWGGQGVGERKGRKGWGRMAREMTRRRAGESSGCCAERESTRARAQRWEDGWRSGLGKGATRRGMG